MENCENKQFTNYKLCAVLSSRMTRPVWRVPPGHGSSLCPACPWCVRPASQSPSSHLTYQRGRPHARNFHPAFCYNFSIFLSLVKLLWCLIYKLNFIRSVQHRKNIVDTGLSTTYGSRHLLGVLERIPQGYKGTNHCPQGDLIIVTMPVSTVHCGNTENGA